MAAQSWRENMEWRRVPPMKPKKCKKRGACPLLDRLPEKLKVRGLSNNE